MTPDIFQHQLLTWFDGCGRKDLPWQQNITPYRIWLSETMLQQTQVSTVIPFFRAFTERFPSVELLAQASIDDVLGLWSGLGYYARARNLHKSAQIIVGQGYFPDEIEQLVALPGIGLSTAGAILSIAFHKSHPILDGNVKRVFTRFKVISGWPGTSSVNKQLWAISAHFTPVYRIADYTQAIMDLGATVCTRSKPNCPACPVKESCQAYLAGNVDSFPTPKAGKKLPVKRVFLLLLQEPGGQIFLEKRPAFGIWGGLWSVPEFSSESSVQDWCFSNNINLLGHCTMASRRHTFSHFHLDYTPMLVYTDAKVFNRVTDKEQHLWCSTEQVNGLGLAAPIKQLLLQLFNNEA